MNIKALNSQDDGSVIASRRNGSHYVKECSAILLRRGGSKDITQILPEEVWQSFRRCLLGYLQATAGGIETMLR